MIYDTAPSPLGEITIATNGKSITEIHFASDRFFTAIPSDWQKNPEHKVLKIARKQLTEYFQGQRKNFDLPLFFSGTLLQNQVWQELQKTPYGKTISYKNLASMTDKPRAIRAVASAVGKNPISIIIPCHRIIASDGSLGGYGSGIDHKVFLLNLEK